MTRKAIWQDQFTQSLPAKGKLALVYYLDSFTHEWPLIAEDMAVETGIPLSECSDWIDRFERKGVTLTPEGQAAL